MSYRILYLLPIHPHRLTHPKPTKKRNLYMSEFNQTIDALIIGERIMNTTIELSVKHRQAYEPSNSTQFGAIPLTFHNSAQFRSNSLTIFWPFY
jgi:hypothetical protein